MDTERCRVLVRVVETGNIRGAAAQLGYTPSGVSRMMAALEGELGLTLLERSRAGVSPTTACEEMLPYLRRIAAAVDACTQAAQALRGLEAGRVGIGIAYPQFYRALTPVLAGFQELHPGIQVSLREANTTPLVRALESGEVDFAIISRRPGAFAWHTLLEDELVALVPADHPLAHASRYPLERVARDPFIDIGPGEDTDNALAFARLGISPNTRFAVSLDSAGYEMVRAGLGVALTNGIHARGHVGGNAVNSAGDHADAAGVAVLPLEPPVPVSIGVATVEGDAASPAARAFAAYALPRLEAAARKRP